MFRAVLTKIRASFSLFTRKKGVAFGLLSFRHDTCLSLRKLLKMSGKPLSLRQKKMVMSCVEVFEKEKAYRKKIHGNDVCRRTAEALGVSERTVYLVKAQMEAGEAAASAGEHSGELKPTEFNRFLRGCIRREIHSFFLRKEYPTMDSLLQACKENIADFQSVLRTTLWRLLKDMGFKYKKRTGRHCVHERADIVIKCRNFLRNIRKVREQGRPIVYLDEMWVNQHHSCTRVREDTEVHKTMADPPSGKGRRLILLHAGSKDEFLPAECKLLFVGRTQLIIIAR